MTEQTPQAPANSSNTFSILAMVLGAISVLLFPIIFGPIAIILAVIAFVKKERLAPVGLAAGIMGMFVGMVFGFIIGELMFSEF